MKHGLLFLLLLTSIQSIAQDLERDRLALVDLYNATNGAEWIGNNWVIPGTSGDNPCGWSGVNCENGRITSLDISGDRLQGTLPAEIGNLTALKKLLINARYSTTTLTGNIPVELGNLINLEELDIAGHAFSSQNAEVIGNLINLKTLSFTPLWTIPNQIFTLTQLEKLVLSLGQASDRAPIGPLPVGLMDLKTLKTLIISNIGFTGQIPVEIGNLTNLEFLTIGGTFLEGRIPASIGNLTNLKNLSISEIKYAGPIPPEIGNLTKLIELILIYNTHTGNIPSQINNFVNATTISFEGNHLTGALPDISALKPGILDIQRNRFNFDGIEGQIDKFYDYSMQTEIPLYEGDGYYFANAGGTLAKNTYRWYVNDLLQATIVGDNRFFSTNSGGHRVEISNSSAPLLTLSSKTLGGGLPVSLISFHIASGSGKNTLTWKTTSETNNKGFEIEKSADARAFEIIGFVDGNGDTKEDKAYQFTDSEPFGITYYRLKQLDHDGKFEHSKIIMVKQNGNDISIYPNPAQNHLTISGLQNPERVSIFNQNGILVSNQASDAKGNVDTRNLTNGIYSIKIGRESKKLLIQK